MTQEDKNLLLKDLCARLPYGVKCCDFTYNDDTINTIETLECIYPDTMKYKYKDIYVKHEIERIKPYLRPMSSMTEDEMTELKWLNSECDKIPTFEYVPVENYRIYDWLNRNHFDYRGLIEKGLAIEVTEKSNPYENNH